MEDGVPEVLLVDFAVVEASEEDPALLNVVGVELDVLPDNLQGVPVDYGDVIYDLVALQLKVVAYLLYVLLVFRQAPVQPEELVVLLVVLPDEKGVHYQQPEVLVELPQVVEDVHEGAHADVVLWVFHALDHLAGQQVELRIYALVLLENVTHMVHLRKEHYFLVQV